MGSFVGLNTIARPYQTFSNTTHLSHEHHHLTFDIIGIWINMHVTINRLHISSTYLSHRYNEMERCDDKRDAHMNNVANENGSILVVETNPFGDQCFCLICVVQSIASIASSNTSTYIMINKGVQVDDEMDGD